MTRHEPIPQTPTGEQLDGILKVAVMAVGGQGGGVLTTWIESLARAQGFDCQATSVAGVAQRTGATVYYLEMAPASDGVPVFSLAPAGGDVDIVIAAELMEAGRAVMRGFVTPDRTTLIASTHRALSVSEKTVPGDGIASSDEVRAAVELAAKQLVMFDLEKTAVENGSVISASLFGALAATGRLPFERHAFEVAIRAGGRGVEPSLKAFGAGYDAALATEAESDSVDRLAVKSEISGPAALLGEWRALHARVDALPENVRPLAIAGLRKNVDFQGVDYGIVYLGRVESVLAQDHTTHEFELTREAAKYIANAMAYDDLIKVADLKTRGTRFARIDREMTRKPDQQMHLTEYFHPRAEEIAGLLPVRLGTRVEANPRMMARLDRWFGKGRRVRSDGLIGFGLLYVLGGCRSWRLKTLRHAREVAHLEAWLSHATNYAPTNYALAVELLRCRRLIKGYSDTHAHGMSNFDRVTGAATLLTGRDDAADWVRRLRTAALQDETGVALDQALQTVRSFVEEQS
jgi:indolepyruvate ferredoxin oxidoreductase, beta subunit